MPKPRVMVLRAPGTNCDEETAYAFDMAGAEAERVHVRRVIESPNLLAQYQVLCFPGGFSYGDDIAAGRILGNQVRLQLAEACQEFRESGGLILGICNGFQVLMNTGLLDLEDDQGRGATLTWNDRGRFEARWVRLQSTPGKCVFLEGITDFELPMAHAEGKFMARDQQTLQALEAAGRLVLRYAPLSGDSLPKPSAEPTVPYPDNPNGAMGDVAGLCDSTGRVLGLMPHPERYVDATQHPNWTRLGLSGAGAGMKVFENSVKFFQ